MSLLPISPHKTLYNRFRRWSDKGIFDLIFDLPPAATVIGDQGYDRDKIRKMLSRQGITSCIPPRRCRRKPVH